MHEEDISRIRGEGEERFQVLYKVKGIPGFRGTGSVAVLASTTFGELIERLDDAAGKDAWCDVRVRRV